MIHTQARPQDRPQGRPPWGPRQVFKFGGTSVGSPDAVRRAMAHVRAAAPAVAVIVSAMNGITDDLILCARSAARGELDPVTEAAGRFFARHSQLLVELMPDPADQPALLGMIQQARDELLAICHSVAILRELSPRTLDVVVARGERTLARLFAAALRHGGTPAEYVDATEILSLRWQAGGLWPDFAACAAAAESRLAPLLLCGVVPVVPGYIGRGPDGAVVTLGRGGSDFSAAILARSLSAAQVVLYKEVDGLMTADPRCVPEARVLPELHYREAAELAYYGAKILHPRTMIPLLPERIPLHVRNTFRPPGEDRGTRIAADVAVGAYPVKALSAVHGQALCAIEGNGMMGVPGIAGRAFSALSQAGHSVTMISQASSESSICFVLPEAEADSAQGVLAACFAEELRARLIEGVRVERGIALLSVVGLGMRGTPGIAARTFVSLSGARINVLAIAQGSSELNITIALHEGDVAPALLALHREFQLDRIRPLAESAGRGASVALLGFGQIGQSLARMMAQQMGPCERDLGLPLRCVALCDRAGLVVAEEGLAATALVARCDAKRAGRPLADGGLRHDGGEGLAPLLAERVLSLPARRPVLVDVTAGDTTGLLLLAMGRGWHVVLANKKPLSEPQARYDQLFATAQERGVSLRYEATVGAGLPVLDTISKLREAGDEIEVVLGCLSGTLGYLMTQLEEGVAFSAAVRRAHQLGYTEPDPREDLSGMDVGRKALILARTLGLRLDLSDVQVEALFPAELSHPVPAGFIDRLGALDREMAERVAAARARGEVLRYLARIERGGRVRVGLEQVPVSSPAGRLRGTDNLVVMHSARYRDNPLVVIGPGAGAEVTAAGVFNDVLAIARG